MTLPTDGVLVVESFTVNAVHTVVSVDGEPSTELAVVLTVEGHDNHTTTRRAVTFVVPPTAAAHLTGDLLTALDVVRANTDTTPQ